MSHCEIETDTMAAKLNNAVYCPQASKCNCKCTCGYTFKTNVVFASQRIFLINEKPDPNKLLKISTCIVP